jgi:OOP family OmpA-OmpF porin
MKKLFLFFYFFLFLFGGGAQAFSKKAKLPGFSLSENFLPPDSVVLITGSVINSKDSTPVVARIRYKKLPHGDDVGIFESQKNGAFEMPVMDLNSYLFEANAEGFYPLQQKIDIRDFNKDKRIEKNFVMVPLRVGQIMEFDNILFEQSEAILLQESYRALDRLVDILIHNQTMVIQLEGHTDFRGPARANKRLARDRVKIIRNYLINKGVDRKRVETKAFGGSQPLTTDDTAEARKLNRRVEIRILEE